ncbi:uncharacterized protein LOC131245149 [Magnolia sinica]|uniref:uncharacterized protein LOC131245149 n=1 Tax=Magnolia sinica TaxID=86752 RepID=UPI00265815F7|nr:uncharacterized protein LOC131245149 [Magnolia sinica]
MADIYQIFIKHLDGRTQCLHLPTPTISGSALKQTLLRSTTRIPPPHSLRLVSGTREISDATLLSASGPDSLFPSCALLLRLRGGKGGFGSLLRGAATKAGQKKTNNFDACRDMSGRRLRHVNAEKKLEEWKADAEERKMEKIAEDFLKKKAKAAKKAGTGGGSPATEKYIEKYREDSAKCMEVVEASVRESFGLYENGKRKVLPSSGPAGKRVKIWLGKEKEVESDTDDDENDEDVKSVVLDDGSCSIGNKQDEGSSGSVSVGQSDGESSGGGSVESNLEEENGNSDQGGSELGEGSGSRDVNADVEGSVEPESGVCAEGSLELGEASGSVAPNAGEEGFGSKGTNGEVEGCVETESVIPESTGISSLEGPLNFEKFNSAAEMEVLGMERLKMELQAHGLKCGGTLQERAARLFLLKTTPIEKLPKKLLAKSKGGNGN